MASCTIEVSVAERPRGSAEPASYLPGEPMSVIVTIAVDEPTVCEALVLRSRVVGEGFSPTTVGFEKLVFEGTWPAGTHVMRRKIRAPDFPPTYHGSWIGWDWWLEAVAHLSEEREARSRERFELRAPLDAGPLEVALPEPETLEGVIATRRAAAAGREVQWSTTAFGAVGAVAAVVGLALRASGTSHDLWGPLVGVGSMVFLMLLAWPAASSVFASAFRPRAFDVAVALVRGNRTGGYRRAPVAIDGAAEEVVVCTVSIDPRIVIDWMRARFSIDERVTETDRNGDQRRTRTFSLEAHSAVRDLAATGAPGEWQCQIPLPRAPEVPCPFEDADGDGLVWRLAIELEHSGGRKPDEPIVRRLHASPAKRPRPRRTRR
jgi:hypothetical protein